MRILTYFIFGLNVGLWNNSAMQASVVPFAW